MSIEDRERIATLEAQQKIIMQNIGIMMADIGDMKRELTRARGMIAGAVLTVSVIWGLAVMVFKLLSPNSGP